MEKCWPRYYGLFHFPAEQRATRTTAEMKKPNRIIPRSRTCLPHYERGPLRVNLIFLGIFHAIAARAIARAFSRARGTVTINGNKFAGIRISPGRRAITKLAAHLFRSDG